jgi:hypothetical protein
MSLEFSVTYLIVSCNEIVDDKSEKSANIKSKV